jgi:hypothetical protein
MVLLKQYRMSLDVVAQPLTLFDSSWEFVSAIADAMEAKIPYAEFMGPIRGFRECFNIEWVG